MSILIACIIGKLVEYEKSDRSKNIPEYLLIIYPHYLEENL